MLYKYTESAVDQLLQSYQLDNSNFISDPDLRFRDLDWIFEEARRLRELFFPCYWNCGSIIVPENRNQLELKFNELGHIFYCGIRPNLSSDDETIKVVAEALSKIPSIREKLKKDVEAAHKGDPAAQSYTEIIRSYPGFSAIMLQRVAHIFYSLHVPIYPRELTEQIHSITGIDIHPGAEIGEYFFIDHGTGVVIGETSEIGNNVRIYQGVTLGALHFKKDGEDLKKGYKRHPTIGNNVVIGMGAAILGPISIGNNVSIGANSWIEESIPDDTAVFISEHPRLMRKQKGFSK